VTGEHLLLVTVKEMQISSRCHPEDSQNAGVIIGAGKNKVKGAARRAA
jgi:hypothetical protein